MSNGSANLALNFQAHGKVQGDWFEDASERILQSAGFAIDDRRVDFPDAGVEVDIIATNRQDISFYITCKGSYQGDRPGCQRTDTLKKAIAEAGALHYCGWGPVLLLTSHLPNTPSGLALLHNVDPAVLFDAINPLANLKRLQWLASATEDQLRRDLAARQTLFNARREPRQWGKHP